MFNSLHSVALWVIISIVITYYPTHSLPVLTTSPLYWNSILSGRVLGLVMHGYLGISLWTPQGSSHTQRHERPAEMYTLVSNTTFLTLDAVNMSWSIELHLISSYSTLRLQAPGLCQSILLFNRSANGIMVPTHRFWTCRILHANYIKASE